MTERAEEYRYYTASAGDVSSLTIGQLTLRVKNFAKIHKEQVRWQARLAGAKI